MINGFNLIATTSRGNERPMTNEILYLLKEELGDAEAQASKTKIRGLIVAKTALDPMHRDREIPRHPERAPIRIPLCPKNPAHRAGCANRFEEIKKATAELAAKIGENETFRVTVEKRFTTLHTKDLIEAAAGDIKHKANLENPDKILLIEVLGALTGLSLLKPNEVLAVVKEKML